MAYCIEVQGDSQPHEVHRLPRGRQQIHDDYGLWICHTNRGNCSKVRFTERYRYFEYYSISHLYDGGGELRLPDGNSQVVTAGDAVIICPGFVHWYGASELAYWEDALCFAGPVADGLAKCGVIRNGVSRMGKGRRLLPVIEAAGNPSRDAQIAANAALQGLLVDLYKDQRTDGALREDEQLSELLTVLQRESRRWWTVEEMAEFCNLGTGQFRRVFQNRTGILPKLYVDQLRVRQIGERLTASQKPIGVIAREFGYRDPYHFSRRFKELTGLSPKQYRQQFS